MRSGLVQNLFVSDICNPNYFRTYRRIPESQDPTGVHVHVHYVHVHVVLAHVCTVSSGHTGRSQTVGILWA